MKLVIIKLQCCKFKTLKSAIPGWSSQLFTLCMEHAYKHLSLSYVTHRYLVLIEHVKRVVSGSMVRHTAWQDTECISWFMYWLYEYSRYE
jgi:hypothetical protein